MGHEGIGNRNHLIDAHANKENASRCWSGCRVLTTARLFRRPPPRPRRQPRAHADAWRRRQTAPGDHD
jgi:hypothetical protein